MKEACGTVAICHGCGAETPLAQAKGGICAECKKQLDENHAHQISEFTSEELFGK